MKSISKPSFHHMSAFVMRILRWILVLNLAVLSILWVLEILSLFVFILMYEALLISILGIFQILATHIYKKNSLPYRTGFRTGWVDFKKFAKLKPEERKRYRQEGIIMIIVGLLLLCGSIVVHFYTPV